MGKGLEVRVIEYPPEYPPAAEVSWWKRYAPHLILAGAIGTIITYFSLRKRG